MMIPIKSNGVKYQFILFYAITWSITLKSHKLNCDIYIGRYIDIDIDIDIDR